MLESEFAAWTLERTASNFTVTVNSAIYKGALTVDSLFNMICKSFKKPPQACAAVTGAVEQVIQDDNNTTDVNEELWAIFIVILLITLTLSIALLIKKG